MIVNDNSDNGKDTRQQRHLLQFGVACPGQCLGPRMWRRLALFSLALLAAFARVGIFNNPGYFRQGASASSFIRPLISRARAIHRYPSTPLTVNGLCERYASTKEEVCGLVK